MYRILLALALLLAGCAPPTQSRERMTVYVYLLGNSQSNGVGTQASNVPSGLPDASIPFYLDTFYYNDYSGTFESLNVDTRHNNYYSHEITVAQRLKEAGLKVAVIKLAKGATYLNMWLAGQALGNEYLVELANAWALLPAQFPGETEFKVLWVTDQGEEEARYFDQPTVQRWAEWHGSIKSSVEGVIGQTLRPYVVRTWSGITGKTFPGVLEAQQAIAAVDSAHLFNTNDLTYQVDGVHRTGLSQQTLGNRIADQILQDIFLGQISNYAAHSLLDHALGNTAYSPAATLYLAAFSAGVESTAIARKAVTNNTTNFPNAASRLKKLAVSTDFAAATADAGSIDEIRIYDASSGGNELARDTLSSPVTINNAGVLTISANALSILLPTGCMSDYLAHKLLDLMFGAVAYSAPATTYLSAFNGDPQGAGSQLHPARVSVTNNTTNWPAAALRTKKLGTLQAHASTSSNLGTATHAAIHDASSGGNLLFSTAITPVVIDGSSVAKTLKYRPNDLAFAIAA